MCMICYITLACIICSCAFVKVKNLNIVNLDVFSLRLCCNPVNAQHCMWIVNIVPVYISKTQENIFTFDYIHELQY